MNGWLPVERRWLLLLLDAVIPALPDDPAPGIGALDLTTFWSTFEATAPPLLRFGARASVWLLTWLPLVTPGFFRPFFALGADARDHYLSAALESRVFVVRQLVQTLKIIACFAMFRDPGARAALGVTP